MQSEPLTRFRSWPQSPRVWARCLHGLARFAQRPSSAWLVAWVVGLSTFLKFWFVFGMTRYREHLISDMGGYWVRALARFGGDETSLAQWGSPWPPLPHILLAQLFRLIHLLQLDELRLEVVLGAQIVLSSISVVLLHRVALRVLEDSRAANVVTVLYAFSYPMAYLCGAVLSEGPAIPLLVAAVWLTVGRERLWYPAAAGALLSLAVALRPAYGPMAAVFGSYFLWRGRVRSESLRRAAVFASAFVLVMAPVVAENARISGGRLNSISANGGLNFLLNFSKVHEVHFHLNGDFFRIIPPATVEHPENGVLNTNVPFHEQGWYYHLGWEYLRRRPAVLLENLRGMETVFFGPMMPQFDDAAGVRPMMAVFHALDFGLFLMIPFLLWVGLFRRSAIGDRWAEVLFLAGLVAVSFATMYVFGAEQRYLYSFLFAIILLAVFAGRILVRGWPTLRRPFTIYVGGLAALWGAGCAVKAVRARLTAPTVRVTITQNRNPLTSLMDDRDAVSSRTIEVDQLRFPFGRTLRHERVGELGFSRDYFIEAEASFQFLTVGQPITFEVYSDDGFRLEMDSKQLGTWPRDRMFPTSPDRSVVKSDGGCHTIRLTYFQGGGPQGLLVFYRLPKEGGREQRYALGESSGVVQFLPARIDKPDDPCLRTQTLR